MAFIDLRSAEIRMRQPVNRGLFLELWAGVSSPQKFFFLAQRVAPITYTEFMQGWWAHAATGQDLDYALHEFNLILTGDF
jgi:hypothetical protein